MASTPPPPDRSFRTVGVVIALCWLAVFFDGMDVNIYGATMPHLLADESLGFSTALAGTIGSWTTFGMLIGALAAGSLTDWLGRKPLVTASVVLFSLGSALCALAPGAAVFGAGRFVSGLGLGGLMPIGLAIVAEFAPPRRAALATGLMMTSYHAGGMADRFGPVKVSALWFLLTACGTFLLRTELPLGAAYAVVFVTGIWLFSAQVMVYAATSRVYAPSERATGLGWVTGIGRTGAVVGPTVGGVVLAGGNAGLGFTTFALTAVLGAAAISLVPLARPGHRDTIPPPLTAAGRPSRT
ncbi:MFS transporter [Streptomyces sp. NPDC052023]|uniref:MFS transporter n=1 Tax=Streptomyces sp. NPDC052023 TaxID=3365681 RepID=UPI0037CE1025